MGFMGLFKKRSSAAGPTSPPPLSKLDEDLPELPPIEDTELPPLEGVHEEMPIEPLTAPKVKEVMPEPVELTPAEEEEGIPHDLKHHTIGGSVFLNVEDYRTILDHAEGVRDKIKDAESVLRKLHQLKEKRQQELRKWQGNIADIQRKLAYVDKALFETKH